MSKTTKKQGGARKGSGRKQDIHNHLLALVVAIVCCRSYKHIRRIIREGLIEIWATRKQMDAVGEMVKKPSEVRYWKGRLERQYREECVYWNRACDL